LRESASLGGIWSLCWFDFTVADGGADAHHRRRRLLELLLFSGQIDRAGSEARTLLLPVFTCAEARREVQVLVDHLEARYPTLTIGPDCFVHDPERRGLVRLAGHHPPLGLRLLS